MSGLQNGGFEGISGPGGWTRQTHDGVEYGEIFSPEGWTAFWREGDYRRPEMKVIPRQAPFLDPARIYGGDWAVQAFTFYGRMHAGLYQVVTGLTPGAKYEFLVYAHAWSTTPPLTGHDDAHCSAGVGCGPVYLLPVDVPPLNEDPENDAIGNFVFQVGVNFEAPAPFGSLDPVRWGVECYSYNAYHKVPPVRFTAPANGRAVVYIRAISLWEFRTSDIYLDDATLVQVSDEPSPGRGQPRIQYARTYVLLPPDADADWVNAAVDATWDDERYTIGGSADDAGVADLDVRRIIAVNPNGWPSDLRAFFDEYYPGVEYETVTAITPDELRRKLSGEDGDGILLGQCDEPWGPRHYGDGGGPTYCAKGCWLGGCAMALRYLGLDAEATPLTVDAAVGPDGYDADYAMKWSAMPRAGLKVLGSTTDADIARAHLDMDYICFAEVLPVSLRHFVMVTRYEGDRYWMYDPWKRVAGWLGEKYSGVESWRMIQPAGAPPPPPPDMPLIGLHLQAIEPGVFHAMSSRAAAMPWGLAAMQREYQATVEATVGYIATVKPRVTKIFQAENAQAIKAVSPETLVILRYFTDEQNLDGNLEQAAYRYVESFADTVRTHQKWIDGVESYNETVCSKNITSIMRAVEFDYYFPEALNHFELDVFPVLLNVAVGNPYHEGGEIELLLPAVRQAVKYGGALGYHCFSSDTDILTQQGWLPLSELVEGQWAIPVATLNTETDEVEYQLPTEYFAHDYKGKMFHTMGKVDIMVTPNHRVWARRRDTWDPEAHQVGKRYSFEFIQAQDLPSTFHLRRDLGKYEGKEQKQFILPAYSNEWVWGDKPCHYYQPPRYIPMDAWLRLFGYWLTEGSSGKHYVAITQAPGDTCDDIKKAIEEAGWKPAWHKQDSRTAGDFQFGGVQLASFLRKFGKSHDKYIPRRLLELPRRQLRILFDAMMAGDGHIDADGVERYYCTASQQLSDDFQELALKLGYITTLSEHCDGYFYINLGTERKEPRTTQDKYTEWIDYDGPVYCVTVPNSLVFVRRNGKPSWQGNSYWLYNDQVSGPGQDWKYFAGRWQEWDKVFAQHGLQPRYIFGECGAFASCNDGWRSGICCGGDWELYQAQILEFQSRLAEWNATHGDRALGGTLFTTCPHWMNWESFRITEPEMIKLADALTA